MLPRILKNHKIVFIFLALVLLGANIFYLQDTWKKELEARSKQSSHILQMAAATFPIEYLKKLDVNDSDINKPEYQDIKSTLSRMKNVNPGIRFAYIYTLRNDKIYFVADSEPPQSPDYSPPGQEYTEVDSMFFHPFSDRQPVVTNPVTDRWGKWVSVLVPLKDLKTDEVVAVLANDYPAASWNTTALTKTLRTGIISTASFILLVAFFVIVRSNRKIVEQESNYRTFFETIDDIFVVGDKKGNILYTNSAAIKKLGYNQKELSTLHVLDLNPKDKRKEAEQIFSDMFAGKRNSCPLPLQRKDGSLMAAETRVWFGRWNGTDCIFGLCKDMSMEQVMLQKFNNIFESNPTLMAVTSAVDNTFTDVNSAFLSRLGYSREEVIGHTAKDLELFVDFNDRDKFAESLKKSGFVKNVPMKVRARSGELLKGLFSGVFLESTSTPYFLTTMIDQTDTKKETDELKKKNEELEAINRIMVGRELKIVELKDQLKKYETKS